MEISETKIKRRNRRKKSPETSKLNPKIFETTKLRLVKYPTF